MLINTNTVNPTMQVTGTGEPGDTVKFTIGGFTQTATIQANGNWSVTFGSAQIPADSNYSATVLVSNTNGASWTLDGPDIVVDLTPPPIDIEVGTKSVGDIENDAEYQNGITISGKGQAGASLMVEIDGKTHYADVRIMPM